MSADSQSPAPRFSPSHANRQFWDSDARDYHAAHEEYLSSFYWCPEMLHEERAQLLGDVSTSTVLELGCGSAPRTAWLQGRAVCHGLRYFARDADTRAWGLAACAG